MISYSIPFNYIPKRNSLVEQWKGEFVHVSLGQKAFLLLVDLTLDHLPGHAGKRLSQWGVLPFAVLFGISVRVMAATFKNIYNGKERA